MRRLRSNVTAVPRRKIRSFGNLGAFVSFRGAMPPVVNIGTVVGTYTAPAVMWSFRHADQHPLHIALSRRGWPEASYMIERRSTSPPMK
jgi:hypothetical protein